MRDLGLGRLDPASLHALRSRILLWCVLNASLMRAHDAVPDQRVRVPPERSVRLSGASKAVSGAGAAQREQRCGPNVSEPLQPEIGTHGSKGGFRSPGSREHRA